MIKKAAKIVGATTAGIAVGFAGACLGFYASRLNTIKSLKKITKTCTPFDLYRIDVRYKYDLDRLIERCCSNDEEIVNAMLREALPFVPVKINAPEFGCTCFCAQDDHHAFMGRNYDFKLDTSALMVHCAPKDGYESIAFAALDNLDANQATSSFRSKVACVPSPLVCLDGINEAGVSIAVLTLDSEPTRQYTGKPVLATTVLIRLVLDRASSTEEAIDLISKYDTFATNGRDYHFFISDANGDSRVVEFDCDTPDRRTVVTKKRTAANYFAAHEDKVVPNQRNGKYGHGMERYVAVEEALNSTNQNDYLEDACWSALRASSQLPNPNDITSNTQWSILFDNKSLTATIAIRRNWTAKFRFSINGVLQG